MSKIRPSTQLAQDGASLNYVLTWDGTKWTAQPSAGLVDPTTTKGDLIVHGVTSTRLPVGTDGQTLLADSTQTVGVRWGAPTAGASTYDDTNLGVSSLDGDGNVSLTYTPVYGINTTGQPYYDATGPVAGEEAVLVIAVDGSLNLVQPGR